MSETWFRSYEWCPYGRHPQPMRVLVELGHEEEGRFVTDSGHLLVDVTDKRNPKIDLSLPELDRAWREAIRHEGGGWTRKLDSMPTWMREMYRV